jgi:hypothetical protein
LRRGVPGRASRRTDGDAGRFGVWNLIGVGCEWKCDDVGGSTVRQFSTCRLHHKNDHEWLPVTPVSSGTNFAQLSLAQGQPDPPSEASQSSSMLLHRFRLTG